MSGVRRKRATVGRARSSRAAGHRHDVPRTSRVIVTYRRQPSMKRVLLITGASSGIGASLVRRFARPATTTSLTAGVSTRWLTRSCCASWCPPCGTTTSVASSSSPAPRPWCRWAAGRSSTARSWRATATPWPPRSRTATATSRSTSPHPARPIPRCTRGRCLRAPAIRRSRGCSTWTRPVRRDGSSGWARRSPCSPASATTTRTRARSMRSIRRRWSGSSGTRSGVARAEQISWASEPATPTLASRPFGPSARASAKPRDPPSQAPGRGPRWRVRHRAVTRRLDGPTVDGRYAARPLRPKAKAAAEAMTLRPTDAVDPRPEASRLPVDQEDLVHHLVQRVAGRQHGHLELDGAYLARRQGLGQLVELRVPVHANGRLDVAPLGIEHAVGEAEAAYGRAVERRALDRRKTDPEVVRREYGIRFVAHLDAQHQVVPGRVLAHARRLSVHRLERRGELHAVCQGEPGEQQRHEDQHSNQARDHRTPLPESTERDRTHVPGGTRTPGRLLYSA